MRPSMVGDLMAQHVLGLEHLRTGDGTRADDVERGGNIVVVKEIDDLGGIRRWPVVVTIAPHKSQQRFVA